MARTAAFSLSALVLYLPAMLLPIMQTQQLGYIHSTTIWGGVVALFAEGQWPIGVIVFFCSIVAPIGKIMALLVLSLTSNLLGCRHRAVTYRFVEWIGRWGMLDVMLVAVLVAAVKLGDWVEVVPGPGLVAFTGVVVLSLLASASFNPHAIWEHNA